MSRPRATQCLLRPKSAKYSLCKWFQSSVLWVSITPGSLQLIPAATRLVAVLCILYTACSLSIGRFAASGVYSVTEQCSVSSPNDGPSSRPPFVSWLSDTRLARLLWATLMRPHKSQAGMQYWAKFRQIAQTCRNTVGLLLVYSTVPLRCTSALYLSQVRPASRPWQRATSKFIILLSRLLQMGISHDINGSVSAMFGYLVWPWHKRRHSTAHVVLTVLT